MSKIVELDEKLKAAGIPILGVSYSSKTDPPTVGVQFDKGATAQQMADGQAIADAFDWNAPEPEPLEIQQLRAFSQLSFDKITLDDCKAAIKALIADRVK